jgi:hypothetical protein
MAEEHVEEPGDFPEPHAPTAAVAAYEANENADNLPPDRLAVDPASPHFDGEVLKRGIGIRFKGAVKTNVEEYSISQGWIRVQAGKSRDRRGQPLTLKLSGPVEAWFEDLGENPPIARVE